MKFLKDNLGLILAGSYAVLMSVVLFFDFQSLGNDFWSSASFNLTLPWSIGVLIIGFGLFICLRMAWNMDSLIARFLTQLFFIFWESD